MVAREKNIISKRLIHSYLSSVISITLVLVLVGASALFAANAGEISRFFKENMVVSLILGQSVTEEEGQELARKLTSDPQVLSADFISREQGTQEMKVLLGEDFLSVFESNPVPLSIDLHLNGDMVSRDSLVFLKSRFLKEPAVEEVVYQESLVEILNANLRKIVAILTGVVIVLLFISFVLINNTVRLNVYSLSLYHSYDASGRGNTCLYPPSPHAARTGTRGRFRPSCGRMHRSSPLVGRFVQ